MTVFPPGLLCPPPMKKSDPAQAGFPPEDGAQVVTVEGAANESQIPLMRDLGGVEPTFKIPLKGNCPASVGNVSCTMRSFTHPTTWRLP
jgi:hypothetical protein